MMHKYKIWDMDKYKIWDEKTATSPSGRHLGHYHALFKPFKYKDDADKIKIEDKRAHIIEVHFIMLQTAELRSHVCKIWTNILTCISKKMKVLPKFIAFVSFICTNAI